MLARTDAEAPPRSASSKADILVVDDNQDLERMLKYSFEKEGYHVFCAKDGHPGLELVRTKKPDLVILDLMMPKMDGFEFLKILRQDNHVPTLILSAKKGDISQVMALKLGADDYVGKPFSIETLIARAEAVIRRRGAGKHSAEENGVLKASRVTLDVNRHEVHADGRAVELTNKEFDLLKALIEAKGHVMSRGVLLAQVWGISPDSDLNTRTVDQHVARIRRKLGTEAGLVATVTHLGYRARIP